MASHYYTHPDEPGLYRRSKQNVLLPISRSKRNETGQEPSDRNNNQVRSAVDGDSKNRTLPQRRRIPVACKRCRRRKIKCSGDPGDGQGCSNCRSSGTPDCQFLRVNSSELQPRASYPSWPYPASNVSSSLGSQPKSYGNNQPTSKGATLSTLKTTAPDISSLRKTSYGTRTRSQRRPSTRHGLPSSVRANYETDSMDSQSTQSPAYPLPHSTLMPKYYEYPEIARLGYSSPTFTRTQAGALYSDQEHLNPFAQTAYPYIESPQTSLSADIPSLFPAIESLSSGQGYDRTLPDPTSRSQLSNSLIATAPSSSVFPPEIDGKSRNQWLSHNSASPRSQASIRSVSNVTGTANPADHAKTASSVAHDVIFKYMTMGNSAPLPPLTSDTYAGDRMETVDDFCTPTDTERTRSLSRDDDDSLLSVDSSSSQLYGYSTSKNPRRRSRMRSSPSSSTLMNGMQYTRVKHSDDPPLLPYELLHPEAALNFQTTSDIHKTSIPSVSNTSSY